MSEFMSEASKELAKRVVGLLDRLVLSQFVRGAVVGTTITLVIGHLLYKEAVEAKLEIKYNIAIAQFGIVPRSHSQLKKEMNEKMVQLNSEYKWATHDIENLSRKVRSSEDSEQRCSKNLADLHLTQDALRDSRSDMTEELNRLTTKMRRLQNYSEAARISCIQTTTQ